MSEAQLKLLLLTAKAVLSPPEYLKPNWWELAQAVELVEAEQHAASNPVQTDLNLG